MENYGIKINDVTFIFIVFFAGEIKTILYKPKEMTPISCYKSIQKEMF